MAIKLPKLFTGTDAKSRVFLLFAAVGAVGLVVFLGMRYFGGGATTTGPSRVAGAPSGLQSVPGGQLTPEYSRAVSQANQQTAQQAQMTGGSAVPTLLNVQGQQAAPQNQNCTVLCPSDENVNVADDINGLVKDGGKFTQADANSLLNLLNNNVPIDQYAAALNELVREGKLTPEQARELLDKYKKQHTNNLLNASAKLMDSMIKSGQMPLDTANQLLALQKNGISAADYAAELNRLVAEGKLSPQNAAQLLAQYTQQQMQEKAKQGAYGLNQMAKAGQITDDVAKQLLALQEKNVPIDRYSDEVNRLLADGKMTPAVAAKLIDDYSKQRSGTGTFGTLNSLVGQEQANAENQLNDLVKSGRISQATADEIAAMERNAKSPADCQNGLGKLVKEKKISAEDAQKVMVNCMKLAAMHAEAARLAALQGNNASLSDYTNELKRAVQSGILTPEAAALLLDQYRAMTTPINVPEGVVPGVEGNIPKGAEGFAQLQQRLQQQQQPAAAAPVANADQFNAANAQVQAQLDQERLQRIEQLQAAMSTQAQTLISAWQPQPMLHKEGSPATDKDKAAGGSGDITKPPLGALVDKSGKPLTKPLLKAGTILFAVLDTGVDSDYPDTPVSATIVQGPLSGSKLIGKLAVPQGKDRLSLTFNLMDNDSWITTKTVNAFAIDPDTARTVMASSVDYHYLSRYGSMFAYSFISGYATAISNSGGTSTTGIFGTSRTNPSLSAGSKLAVAIGQIGNNMSSTIQTTMNTPPTIKVNAGVGLGILFMSEVAQ